MCSWIRGGVGGVIMVLKGQLLDLSVSDIIRILCFGLTRACVKLTNSDTKAEVYFDNGNIINARCGSTTGLDALYNALALKDGKYQLELNTTSLERTIQTPWRDILKGWDHS